MATRRTPYPPREAIVAALGGFGGTLVVPMTAMLVAMAGVVVGSLLGWEPPGAAYTAANLVGLLLLIPLGCALGCLVTLRVYGSASAARSAAAAGVVQFLLLAPLLLVVEYAIPGHHIDPAPVRWLLSLLVSGAPAGLAGRELASRIRPAGH